MLRNHRHITETGKVSIPISSSEEFLTQFPYHALFSVCLIFRLRGQRLSPQQLFLLTCRKGYLFQEAMRESLKFIMSYFRGSGV